MTLINPSSEEANSAMAAAANSEKLRRELEAVFRANAETVADLDEGALVTVVLDALRHAR
ncbi:hypothetical protein [Microbacterium sp. NPDC087868]|uniref:hypothetical protein n=1 Tax=Microbacterium sp. NPDC087868 TaxID=3364195 RepID=UPI00384C868E